MSSSQQTAAGACQGRAPGTALSKAGACPDGGQAAGAWLAAVHRVRFPLVLAVVSAHAGGFVAWHCDPANHGWSRWTLEWIRMLSLVATPVFLLIAGFLFFRDGRLAPAQYWGKLRSRGQTLLTPYLIWNVLFIFLYCAPAAAKAYLGKEYSFPADPLSWRSLVQGLIGWPLYPADAPLWFVRDLLLLILFAPVLNLVSTRLVLCGAALLGLYWLGGPVDWVPGGVPRAFSVFFFCTGAWMGLGGHRPWAWAGARWFSLGALLALVAAATVGASTALNPEEAAWHLLADKCVRLSAVVLVVFGASLVRPAPWLDTWLMRGATASFFVFAFHFATLFALGMGLKNLPQLAKALADPLALYVAAMGLGIGGSLALFSLLRRYAPTLLGLLDGNRSARPAPVPGRVVPEGPAAGVGAGADRRRAPLDPPLLYPLPRG